MVENRGRAFGILWDLAEILHKSSGLLLKVRLAHITKQIKLLRCIGFLSAFYIFEEIEYENNNEDGLMSG